MAKLTLKAPPTFKAKVAIPVPGGNSVNVEMTFKHRKRSDLKTFIESRDGKSDAESFLDMVEGWELEDAFNEESVELLLQNYQGAALQTYMVYMQELTGTRPAE